MEEAMRANRVPLVFLAVKEDDGAREELREKRRLTCVSLGAGSKAGEELRSRTRVRNQEAEKDGNEEQKSDGVTDEKPQRIEGKDKDREGESDFGSNNPGPVRQTQAR